jgi:NNP family nitrate/nitrite transporter-like MFS transporter
MSVTLSAFVICAVATVFFLMKERRSSAPMLDMKLWRSRPILTANLATLLSGMTIIGLTTFLPSYYYDQFGVSKVQAGQLTMLAAFMGATVRVFGGWISDRWGGINTLTTVLVTVMISLLACGLADSSLAASTLLFMVCFAALGAGNGALFQLVPLRWPLSTAVAGSMIGEIGALGGGLVPNAMGLSKQYTGSYLWGFVLFAVLALIVLLMMRKMQLRWTRTWAEKGGRARVVPA